MKEKKYILSLVTVYMCYFTHGMQAIILSQNQSSFYKQWGYSDATAGAAAVSLAITAVGFGKFLTVWLGGEFSDKIGRKKMAIAGGLLYILCFAGLLFTTNFTFACICAFLSGVATSGFWDASLYPAAQEAAPKFAGSALIGIKLFVSISGIIYPLLVVQFTKSGNWHINIWIPFIFSIICTVLAMIAPFAYDDMMKEKGTSADGKEINAAQAEIEAAKARMLVKPNKLVNFITMFYGFLCMFIMYGAQQYTKAFGMSNCGLTEMQAAALTSVYTFGSIIAVIFWAIMMGKLKWNPLKVVLIDSIFSNCTSSTYSSRCICCHCFTWIFCSRWSASNRTWCSSRVLSRTKRKKYRNLLHMDGTCKLFLTLYCICHDKSNWRNISYLYNDGTSSYSCCCCNCYDDLSCNTI